MPAVRRYIGIDETGSLFDRDFPVAVVMSVSSTDPNDAKRYNLGSKRKDPGQKFKPPAGNFKYVGLRPDILSAAKYVYGEPQTRTEISWNGSFYVFRTYADAIITLLEASDFDPRSDVVLVDAFGKCNYLREELARTWMRNHGVEVPGGSIVCKRGFDMVSGPVRTAHDNAQRLHDRLHYPDEYDAHDRFYQERAVDFGRNDMMRLHLNRHERREAERFFEDDCAVA